VENKPNLTYTNEIRTVCEVIRELNDIVCDQRIKKGIRSQLKEKADEIYTMVKKMNKKLVEYKDGYDRKWYKENENYGDSLSKRGHRKRALKSKHE